MRMFGKIGAMLGISSFASRTKHEEEKRTEAFGDTYHIQVTREEALKKRKARKDQKAQKKARRANRVRR